MRSFQTHGKADEEQLDRSTAVQCFAKVRCSQSPNLAAKGVGAESLQNEGPNSEVLTCIA